MREIKFRAWHQDTKKMLDLKKMTPLALSPSLDQDGLYIPFIKDLPLMQYTGLKDKNGKEIYEGDIIRFKDAVNRGDGTFEDRDGEIIFEDGGFACKADSGWQDWLLYALDLDLEIIGNLYENPELKEER